MIRSRSAIFFAVAALVLAGARTPEFELQLIAAGNAAGQAIRAAAVLELQEGRAQ